MTTVRRAGWVGLNRGGPTPPRCRQGRRSRRERRAALQFLPLLLRPTTAWNERASSLFGVGPASAALTASSISLKSGRSLFGSRLSCFKGSNLTRVSKRMAPAVASEGQTGRSQKAPLAGDASGAHTQQQTRAGGFVEAKQG